MQGGISARLKFTAQKQETIRAELVNEHFKNLNRAVYEFRREPLPKFNLRFPATKPVYVTKVLQGGGEKLKMKSRVDRLPFRATTNQVQPHSDDQPNASPLCADKSLIVGDSLEE